MSHSNNGNGHSKGERLYLGPPPSHQPLSSSKKKTRLQTLMEETWPEEDQAAAVRAMSRLAVAGSVEAFKVLMAYTYGKPVTRVELSDPDGKPVKVYAGFDPTRV